MVPSCVTGAWVLVDGLLKILDGFLRRLDTLHTAHGIEAPQKKVLGLWIDWPGSNQEVLLLLCQFDLNFPGHCRCSRVRHPPRSGWLGEWGRLKGGCPVG
jgi:hypothetical protein